MKSKGGIAAFMEKLRRGGKRGKDNDVTYIDDSDTRSFLIHRVEPGRKRFVENRYIGHIVIRRRSEGHRYVYMDFLVCVSL